MFGNLVLAYSSDFRWLVYVTDYSLVIPAFDEELLLPDTLAALRDAMASISLDGEIVVVDNNSKDATAKVAKEAGARVIFEPVNRISTARNAGALAARGKWLCFVDADTHVPPALLGQALDALAGGEIGGGGAGIRFDREVKGSVASMLGLWNRLSRFFKVAAGSFIFCRRDGFSEVGGFSDKVYAGEEVFFSSRYKRWCRRQGLTFTIIEHPPVVTSARKLDWHSPVTMAGVVILPTLCPFLLCSRRFCSFWYVRPKQKRKRADD